MQNSSFLLEIATMTLPQPDPSSTKHRRFGAGSDTCQTRVKQHTPTPSRQPETFPKNAINQVSCDAPDSMQMVLLTAAFSVFDYKINIFQQEIRILD